MKSALSKLFGFVAGYDRREKSNPAQRSYCVCGAYKRQAEGIRSDASLKTDSSTESVYKPQK